MRNKMKFFLLTTAVLSFLAACSQGKNASSDESSKRVQHSSSSVKESSSENGKFATKEDVIKEEPQEIDGKKYILYTFKGNKATALPEGMEIEDAKIDLSQIPEVGTPKEEVEK